MFFDKDLVKHKSASAQEMAWRQTGGKPLSKQMKTKESDAISQGYNELTHGGHKKHGWHLQNDTSNLFLEKKIFWLKIIWSSGPIDKHSSLVQVIT